MDDLYTQVGARIRKLREQKGWTQEVLAAETHIHRSYVWSIETGTTNLSLQTLEPLALALDVSLEELFKGVQLDPDRLKARKASGPSRADERRSALLRRTPERKQASAKGRNQVVPPQCKLIGDKVRLLRETKGLSQDAFARRSRLHRSHIGEIERGETNLTMATMTTLAKTLKVSLQDLMQGVTAARRPAARSGNSEIGPYNDPKKSRSH